MTVYVILLVAGLWLGTKFSNDYGTRHARLYVCLGMLLIFIGLAGFLSRLASSADNDHVKDDNQEIQTSTNR